MLCKACVSPLFMCFSPYLGVGGGGGAPKGSRAQPAYAVFPPQQLKNGISEPNFVDTLTIQNDQISHVKHVLAPLYVFFTLFGCCGGGGGGGLPRGLGYKLLMQFSRLSSSKMEISEADFFDTLTIHIDQISHVKHALAPLYAFFTLFGCWGWGGSQGV